MHTQHTLSKAFWQQQVLTHYLTATIKGHCMTRTALRFNATRITFCSLTGRSDGINPCVWSPTLCCEHGQCFLQVDIIIFCLHWLTCHNCNNTSKRHLLTRALLKVIYAPIPHLYFVLHHQAFSHKSHTEV